MTDHHLINGLEHHLRELSSNGNVIALQSLILMNICVNLEHCVTAFTQFHFQLCKLGLTNINYSL